MINPELIQPTLLTSELETQLQVPSGLLEELIDKSEEGNSIDKLLFSLQAEELALVVPNVSSRRRRSSLLF